MANVECSNFLETIDIAGGVNVSHWVRCHDAVVCVRVSGKQ